jgi:hypothetical protein
LYPLINAHSLYLSLNIVFDIGHFWETHPKGKIRTFQFLFVWCPRCFNQWWETHFCDRYRLATNFLCEPIIE